MMATEAWTTNFKFLNEQPRSIVRAHVKDTNARGLMCGHLAGSAKLFHRSVLMDQPGDFLLQRGTKTTLVLIFLALRCVRTGYGFQMNGGCTLGIQMSRITRRPSPSLP